MKYCFVILLGAGAILWAQRPGWNFGPAFRGHFEGKVVTGEPYSGTAVTTRTQTLAGGNTINEASCAKVYRDTSGRTRREETRNAATCSTTPETIFISDPVAGLAYVINTKNSTYRQFTIKAPAANATAQTHTRPANPNAVETALGTKAIPGSSLSAQGTQIVNTIPAGRLGNAQAITTTSTRWYSPDLQIVTESTRTDPRNGTTSYLLTISSQAEPAESLFQLPPGLTLEQGPARGAHRAP